MFFSFFGEYMIIIEGNIGAGKSTFLQLLKNHIENVSIVKEPVIDWQQRIYGQSLLTNFYENPKRWAYTFETMTFLSRVFDQMRRPIHSLSFAERSIYSGFYCFAQNSFEQHFLNPLEFELYKEWFYLFGLNKSILPQAFIYIQVDPEICYQRVKKRKRNAEKNISLSYLRQIHKKHEQFLIKQDSIDEELKSIPILILKADDEFEYDKSIFQKHLKRVRSFIETLNNK